ncbi:alpha-N-acetylglucosaminidase TIM-barrel domain-containing protein [Clostridium nigeriense]|uniref:alpha-N-acetylglucosaminidase TIM-barrel domain-containing protein n=1 Tax=Clostridium nigeriense TaxID=1805470 RepID=UPI003D3323BD
MKNVKRQVARALAITITASMLTSIPFPTYASTENKISSDKMKITAKSNTEGHDSQLAIDGDVSTYWESSNNFRWVELELDGTYDLSGIKIYNKQNGYYNYNIYATSDGENYEKVAYKSDNSVADDDGDFYSLSDVRASKIRIDVTFTSDNNDSNIAEIEVFGNKVSSEVAKETPISVENFEDTKWSEEYNKFENNINYANEKTINEMTNMVGRVIGDEYKDSFKFEIIEQTSSGNDVFEVEDGADGKIVVRGNDGVSLASGFNYYLKNYAKVMYNPIMGSNLNMPEVLPNVGEKVAVDTPYEQRYSLNFCTYSYTMAFWDWNEYEAFIDWSAMNGFNLILDIVGQEEVLRRTLSEFGYSDEEIKEYISGPGYFAWFYMQNMTSFGGPLPNNWFEDRAELGRQMHDRMQTLGITPVLQGYSGGVPLDFTEKNPDAQVIKQGEWCGFDRPDMLKTYVNEGEEDYFAKVADAFYKAQKEVFGDVSNYYAVDPFHEGGNTGGLNNGKIYETVQNKMIEHDEDSVWVIQHWQGNPNNEKLSGLKKDQALILDLNSDLNPDWNRFDSQDLPWVWNMLHNFGGRMGLDGQPEILANNIPAAYAESENMKGIGITPEAINNSPIVYELIGDMIWTRDSIDFRQWTKDYIERRYGKVNEDIQEAWNILLETAYKKTNDYYQGAAESVINSRPATEINSASTWGHNNITYDKEELEKALQLFISSYDELKDSEAFIYDFLDVTKQVLANSAQEYHKEMVAAYDNKDLELFKKISTHFLELIKLQEEVLSTSPEFLVGTWIDQARTMLSGADDWTMDLFEFNARALITTWGDYKNPDLKDYSNRQWAGLTEDLYYKRWETWVNNVVTEIETGSPAPEVNWHKMEYQWANTKTTEDNRYTTEGSGEDLGALARMAMDKFSVTNMDEFLDGESNAVEKVNIALGKNVVVEGVETDVNYPAKNLTDGTTGTAWMGTEVKWPVTMTIDLEGERNLNGIAFAPNQAAGGFHIDYKVEVRNGDTWNVVGSQEGDSITGTISLDYKGTADAVRYTFKSDNKENIPEMTELMVYENAGEKVVYDNIALKKPVKVEGADTSGDRPSTNLTDGNDSTIWAATSEALNSSLFVDLEGTEFVDKVEIVHEKEGLPFKFTVSVTEKDGTETVILDKSTESNALDRRYTIDVNREIKGIRYTFHGKNNVGSYPGAWAGLAEIKALRKQEVKIEAVNVALDKPVTGSTAENGRPLSNVTDGKDDTLWVADGGKYPSNVNVDLVNSYYVDNLELVFEKEGLPFKFYVDVVDGNNETHRVLDMTSNDKVTDLKYNIPVNKNIKKIKVEITGNNGQGNAYLAWPAVAEIRAFSRPENVAINATVNPLEGEFLIDGNETSGTNLNADSNKEYVIDFGKIVDINTIETIGKADGGLKYTVEYRSIENEEEWIELVDNSENTSTVEKILTAIKNPIATDAIRINFANEELTVNEVKVYKADVTGKLVNYIGEVEKIYNNAKEGEYAGQYPNAAKNELLTAINSAKAASMNGINSVEVETEIVKLKEAVNKFYSQVVIINRKDLLTTISDANIVLNALKTSLGAEAKEDKRAVINDSIANLKTGITEAQAVYDTKIVTQKELDEAKVKLKLIIEEGYVSLDADNKYKVELEIAEGRLNDAVVGEGNGQFLQSDVESLKAVIAKAKEDYTRSTTIEEVEKIIDTLKNAVGEFDSKVIIVNKDALEVAITNAEETVKNAEGKYYAEAVEKFVLEINKAKVVLLDSNASQATVDESIKELLNAESELLKSALPDKTELKNLINEGKELIKDLGKYECLSKLKTELEKLVLDAENIRDNNEATLEEITVVVEGLKNKVIEAKEALKVFENTSKVELEEVIKKSEALNKNDYTKDSYKALLVEIKEGKKVLESEKSTQADIDSAIARINNAIKSLVKLENGNGGNNNSSNNGNANNNSGDQANNVNNNGTTGKEDSKLPQTGGALSILTLILGGATTAVGGLLVRKKKEN